MKLNISYPPTARAKGFKIEDEQAVKSLFDRRLAEEINGESLGNQFNGYIFKITGGYDKDGFSMMQGVLTSKRLPLLLGKGHTNFHLYRGQKRKGMRKRKNVRGCIVSADTGFLNLVIVKKGEQEIPGVTEAESNIPNRLGPKRVGKIRKLWNLQKEDDVRRYVIRRTVEPKEGKSRNKPQSKAPKIQRLVTPRTKMHTRRVTILKQRRALKAKAEAQNYEKMLSKRKSELRSKRQSKLSKARRSKVVAK